MVWCLSLRIYPSPIRWISCNTISSVRLKISGLSGHSYLIPDWMAMGAVNPSRVRTLVVTPEYMCLMVFIILGGNPWSSRALKIEECGTELLDKFNQPITSSAFLALASRMTSCGSKLCSKHPSNWRKPFFHLLNRWFFTDHLVGQIGL